MSLRMRRGRHDPTGADRHQPRLDHARRRAAASRTPAGSSDCRIHAPQPGFQAVSRIHPEFWRNPSPNMRRHGQDRTTINNDSPDHPGLSWIPSPRSDSRHRRPFPPRLLRFVLRQPTLEQRHRRTEVVVQLRSKSILFTFFWQQKQCAGWSAGSRVAASPRSAGTGSGSSLRSFSPAALPVPTPRWSRAWAGRSAAGGADPSMWSWVSPRLEVGQVRVLLPVRLPQARG